jgi:hypothetical protein
MSDYKSKYPQPDTLSNSAYDAQVPRSMQEDIDYIEAQQNRIFYLDNRVVRLEQLLLNREHSIKTQVAHIQLLEEIRDKMSKTIDEKNKEIVRLELKEKIVNSGREFHEK